LLENVTWQIVGVLGISFLREQHHISKEIASLIYSGFAIAVFAGALSGGKIVERFGRKRSTVYLTMAYGLSAILFATVPDPLVAAALGILSCLLVGLRQPSINSLTVEQIPAMRGPLMSLSQASENIGGMIGAAIAGLLLLSFGWITCGVLLASAVILASIILQALAKDPTTSTLDSSA